MLEQNNHISLVSAVSFLFATSIFLPSESQNSQAPTAWLMQFSVSPAKTNFLLFPFLDLGTSEKAVTLGGKKVFYKDEILFIADKRLQFSFDKA